jgi:hypothetical protein
VTFDVELDAVLAGLPETSRAIILDRLARAGSRSPRLDERDEAIRRLAVEHFRDLDRKHRAAAVARALDREAALPVTTADERRTALRDVLSLNRGRGLTRQQVGNILAGARSPRRGQEGAPLGSSID